MRSEACARRAPPAESVHNLLPPVLTRKARELWPTPDWRFLRPRARAALRFLLPLLLLGFLPCNCRRPQWLRPATGPQRTAFSNASRSHRVAALASRSGQHVSCTHGADGRMMRPVVTAGQSPAGSNVTVATVAPDARFRWCVHCGGCHATDPDAHPLVPVVR